jgi:hypothetical protein
LSVLIALSLTELGHHVAGMMFEVISKIFFESASFEDPRVAVLAKRA